MAGTTKKARIPEAKTREAILIAAMDEFAEHGYAGARTENIARAAKVNKAMLHYYFHDKETLYRAVLDTIYGPNSEADELAHRLISSPINSVQQIHILLKIIIAKHGDPGSNSFRCILAWELAAGQNNLKRVAQKHMVPRIAEAAEIIRRGIAAGQLKCENPTLAVWSLVSQVAFYYMHRETYEDSAIYDELYRNVTQKDLLNFLLRNFIAAYAVDKNILSQLPPDLDILADELAKKMSAPSLPVT